MTAVRKRDDIVAADAETLRLEALRRYAVLDTPPEERFDRVVHLVTQMLGVPASAVSFVDRDRQWFKASSGVDFTETDRSISFCTHVVAEGAPLVVENAAHDDRFRNNPLVTGPNGLRFYAGMPLFSRDGFALGSLCAIDTQPRRLSEEQRKLLEDSAALVGDLLDARLQRILMQCESTKLSRARSQLKDHERRLALAATSAEIALWEWDAKTNELEISDHWTELLGCPASEGSDWRSALHEDDLAQLEEAMTAYAAGHRSELRANVRIKHQDEGWRWLRVAGSALRRQADGTPTRLVGTIVDNTDLKESERRAVESSKRLNLAERVAKLGHWRFVPGDRSFIWSPGMYKIFGLPVAETAPTPRESLALLDAADRPRMEEAIRHAIEAKQGFELEVRGSGPKGLVRHLQVKGEVHLDEDGEVEAVFGILQDDTEKQTVIDAMMHAQLQAEEATRAAENANKLKTEFLANMSHEIRTPLNGMLGMAQLLQRADLGERETVFVSTILSSGEALLNVINDVLDISKIESGLLKVEAEPFDPNVPLRTAYHSVCALALEKSLTLKVSGETSAGAPFHGDKRRITQILINLVGNAVKFTDRGGVELSMSRHEDGSLTYAVTDSGPGISPDDQDAIFGRFTQIDGSSTRKHGGTGLGLAICKELAALMGGEIGVDSRPGEGARFWLHLPPASQTQDALEGQDAHGSGPDAAAARKNPPPRFSILLAEDNEVNVLMIEEALSCLGWVDVTAVENGAQALEALRQDSFDLVLMDIGMPVMTGDEAIRRIRSSHAPWRDVPIVAITANSFDQQRQKYLDDGADDYMAKPVDLAELERRIRTLAGRSSGSGTRAESSSLSS